MFPSCIQNYHLSVIHGHIQSITQDNISLWIKEEAYVPDNSNFTFPELKLGNMM